jgi:hypothetical protein
MRRLHTGLAVAVAALLVMSITVVVTAQDDAPPPRIVVLAREDVPVDALAASAVIAQLGGVVLVTPRDHLGGHAEAGIRDFAPDLVVLAGGVDALTDQVEADVRRLGYAVQRVGGGTRGETAQLLAALLRTFGVAFLAVDGTAENARQLDGLTLDEVVEAAREDSPQQPASAGSGGTSTGGSSGPGPLVVHIPYVTPATWYSGCSPDWAPVHHCVEEGAPTVSHVIGTTQYPTGSTFRLEVALTLGGGETICVRLRELDGDPVAGSELCQTSVRPEPETTLQPTPTPTATSTPTPTETETEPLLPVSRSDVRGEPSPSATGSGANERLLKPVADRDVAQSSEEPYRPEAYRMVSAPMEIASTPTLYVLESRCEPYQDRDWCASTVNGAQVIVTVP